MFHIGRTALILIVFFACTVDVIRGQQRIDVRQAKIDSLHEDASHIKEHLKDIADFDTSELSPSELDFHYFKLHDFDNNNKLDGLEMLQALMHNVHTPEVQHNPNGPPAVPVDITAYTNIIDEVLKDDDLDNDGYLSYEEYQNRVKPAP
ncbi:hypothetical protein BV898_05894 [Hypsibius exemplaris]|uniref:EF-hand domain-containing protein n=1 Tax=Hypsibius exemplaris TaxID=2072580 RepID=A0A1W0WY20_HYPEX|nr:hypothetical protein BV898_05894 [Hypsibius exemplaris]